MKTMNFFNVFFVLAGFLLASPALAQDTAGYNAVYRSGGAPFEENTRMRIAKSGTAYMFVPEKGQAWNLPLKSIRGATVGEKGMWFYWFDESNNTLNGYFEIADGGNALVADINTTVKAFFSQPVEALEQYQQKYEQYKDQAIETAQ